LGRTEEIMRTIAACLGLCLLLAAPELVSAQTPTTQIESARNNKYRNIRRPMTPAEQMIYQRAVRRAVQREARLNAQKWAGYSPLRPTISDGHYSADLNRFVWVPYQGFYGTPFGY
jgi:hypothetical protein